MRSQYISEGQKIGKLKVVRRLESGTTANGKRYGRWKCRCDCGNEIILRTGYLQSGDTKSCGCYRKEITTLRSYKHGHSRKHAETRTYKAWQRMFQRCTNPNNPDYKYYGGRGIKISELWINSFENFLIDMGECPKGLSLDRIDNNGNYEPGNCRWSTWMNQQNNRRSNIRIWFAGTYYTMSQLCKELNLNYDRFHHLYRVKNLSLEEILLTKNIIGLRRENGHPHERLE